MTYLLKLKASIGARLLGIFQQKNSIFDFSKITFWNKFFVLIFTTIIWICLLAILGSSILERIVNPIKFAQNTNIILEIYPENTKAKTESKYLIVAEYLKQQPYVKDFERVSDEKILEIIKNFSGDFKNNLNPIQLPIILSIQLNKGDSDKIETLRLNLSQKVKNTFIDSEQELLQRLMSPLSAVKYFSFIIPLLALVILMSILFLIIYAILFSHKATIETLIFLGIYKKTLVMEFGRWVLINSIKSILFALALTTLTLGILIIFFNTDINTIPFNIYIYFILFIVSMLPILSMTLGITFVNKIITKSFNKNLV